MPESVLRPPGAVAEKEFLARCIHCGQCAAICPYGSVRMDKGKGIKRHTPEIYPTNIPCYLCMKCPPVCPTGALNPRVKELQQAGMGKAAILKSRCHNYNGGIMCWTCYDRCPLRGSAIILKDGFTPAITDACVGCGICEYVCPVQGKAICTLRPDQSPPEDAIATLKTTKTQQNQGEKL